MNARTLLTLLSFGQAVVAKVRAHHGERGNELADKVAKGTALSVHVSLQPASVARIQRELDAELGAMGHSNLLATAILVEYTECLTAHRLPFTVFAGDRAFDTRKHLMSSLQTTRTDVLLAQQPTASHRRMNLCQTRQAYRDASVACLHARDSIQLGALTHCALHVLQHAPPGTEWQTVSPLSLGPLQHGARDRR